MIFMIILIGLLIVLGGLLPLLVQYNVLPSSIPHEGLLYQLIIILIGIIAIWYGLKKFKYGM